MLSYWWLLGVRENNFDDSRIPTGRNDRSLNQPWVKMMGQVGKIYVNRIGRPWQLTKGKKGVEGKSSFIPLVGLPVFEKLYNADFSSS